MLTISTLATPLWALTLNGVTLFGDEVAVNAHSAGVIQAVRVAEGQRVKKGDVLIELDHRPMQVAYDRAIALHKAQEPTVQNATFEFERARELYDRDSLSEFELRKAEMNLTEAQARLDAAAADVRLAEIDLERATLRSPVSALVLEVAANAGQYVDPAASLGSLVRLVVTRKMLARATLTSEQWDPGLQRKKTTVVFRGKSYNGRVSHLGYTRVEQAGGLPAYQIEVSFSPDQPIPAQMPVSIEFAD
jgi:RND family efflux transporter MFP subunit